MWASMAGSKHSLNIAANPVVSGSIFMTGLPGFGLDGLQYQGTARREHLVHAARSVDVFVGEEQGWPVEVGDTNRG